jgi:hypothetical protein
MRWTTMVAAAVRALAACSDGSGRAAPLTTARSPLVVTAELVNGRGDYATAVLDIRAESEGKFVDVLAQGQLDAARHATRLELTVFPADDDPRAHGVERVQAVMTREATYLGGDLPRLDGRWVAASDLEARVIAGVAPLDPLALLEGVARDGEKVTESGLATVNGIRTTKYAGTADFDGRRGASMILTQFGLPDLTRVPFEVYVGDDGMPARLVLGSETDTLKESILTINFIDWGNSLNVPIPADPIDARTYVTS